MKVVKKMFIIENCFIHNINSNFIVFVLYKYKLNLYIFLTNCYKRTIKALRDV